MEEKIQLKHPLYTQATPHDADAVNWIFTDKDSKLQKFYYKFPPIKTDEVRVKIKYAGLCQTDCLNVRGAWGAASLFPISPGHEIIGEVSLAGPSVKNFKKGDIVGIGFQRGSCNKCDLCQEGKNNLCYQFEKTFDPYFGGYGTHIQLSEQHIHKVPSNLPLDISAPLLCAGITVFAPILRWHENTGKTLKKQGKVGVFGIGGLGHLAVQYLNKMGHHVTAFTSSLDKEKELKQMGAHDIKSSTDLQKLMEPESQNQYDMILNTLFTKNKEQLKAIQLIMKKGGTLLQLGIPPTSADSTIDVFQLAFKQQTIQGSLVGSFDEQEKMLKFSADHKVYPTCEVFGFEDFPKAFDKLEHGRPKFRACVNVEDWSKQNGFYK